MDQTKNKVLETVFQFESGKEGVSPESIILGYSKLLAMNEVKLKSIISEEAVGELESARAWFEKKGIDSKLVSTGLKILLPYLSRSEEQEKLKEAFVTFVDEKGMESTNDVILDEALRDSAIPFAEVFAKGSGMDAVFAQVEKMKETMPKKKEEPEKSGDETGSKPAEGSEGTASGEGEPKGEKKPKIEPYNPEMPYGGKTGNGSEEEPESNEPKEIKVRDIYDLSERIKLLSTSLLSTVIGQEQAVLKFLQGYSQGELLKQTERGNHPRSYFFFFGPPGVGKTLLAETAANTLGIPFKEFNMSEFANSQSVDDLIGSSNKYSNTKEGNLTGFVKNNPECILLFDEFEKANISVIRVFLQLLGSGKLHDVSTDKDVSFKDAIIIFTSNVGKKLYDDTSVNLTTLPDRVLVEAIGSEENRFGEKLIPPEMCSRIASGNVVMFNHIGVHSLVDMVRNSFDQVVAGMEKEFEIAITYDKSLPLLFLYNRGGGIDARVAVGQSGIFIKNEIFELLRQLSKSKKRKIKKIHLDIDFDSINKELMPLFRNETKTKMMAFTGGHDTIFDLLDKNKYEVVFAGKEDDVKKVMKKEEVSAVLINPFGGNVEETNHSVLSIADYETEGVSLFHNLIEKNANLPIYLLELDTGWSDIDRRTFIQEGATGTIKVNEANCASFCREIEQLADELYMQKESQQFSRRGFVLDYKTKQEVSATGSDIDIRFYDIKKRVAVDLDTRNAMVSDATRPSVRFDDVIGAETAKEELKYFVKYLQKPKQFLVSGGKPPKGVLLYGPPGTGKTMLAKALAGEANVAFFSATATSFMNSLVGQSEENIRKLFEKARKYAPAIVFIDEIDAIGKQRTGSSNTHHTETMLNELLVQMDGFASTDPSKPVFVLAATNYGARSDSEGISGLDEALVRRFDNQIKVDLPKEKERKEYVLRTIKKRKADISEEVAQNVAERTPGLCLAKLENILEMAFRNASKAGRPVNGDDLLTALEDYLYGEKRENDVEYYKSVAIHELGHAYVAYISGDKPSYITIESRGNFGGYMQHSNQENTGSYSKEDILAKIRCSLAGRACEEVFYGKEKSLNTGASSDLKNATYWAFNLICSYGMEEGRLIVLDRDEILKSSLAADYVKLVNDILTREMANTIEILEKAKDKIQSIADVLVRENRLTGEEFEKLMNE